MSIKLSKNGKPLGRPKGSLNKSTIAQNQDIAPVVTQTDAEALAEMLERIQFAKDKLTAVLLQFNNKKLPGYRLSGLSGIGKTHLVAEVMKDYGFTKAPANWDEMDEDDRRSGNFYKSVSGNVTTSSLYTMLYQYGRYENVVMIFDDVDMTDNMGKLNYIKAATDMEESKSRTISNNSPNRPEKIPASFQVKAVLVFCDNDKSRSKNEHMEAVYNRLQNINLRPSLQQAFVYSRYLVVECEQPIFDKFYGNDKGLVRYVVNWLETNLSKKVHITPRVVENALDNAFIAKELGRNVDNYLRLGLEEYN